MSYIVARESEDAAKAIVQALPLQELDYGSAEVNEYAKTLPDRFFIRTYLQRNHGWNNTTEMSLMGPRGIIVEYLVHYNNRRKEYTITRNGHNILDRPYASESEFVKAAAAKFTRAALLKFFKDKVTWEYQLQQKVLQGMEQAKAWEHEHNPKNWTREKQEQRFAELSNYLETTTDMYSDDSSVYDYYSDRVELHHKLKELLGK